MMKMIDFGCKKTLKQHEIEKHEEGDLAAMYFVVGNFGWEEIVDKALTDFYPNIAAHEIIEFGFNPNFWPTRIFQNSSEL